MYNEEMQDEEQPFFWAENGTEESRLFYESAMKSLYRQQVHSSEEQIAGEVVAKIFNAISRAIEVFGEDGEEEDIRVRCRIPKDTGGIWALDIRFNISGKNNQVLVASRSVSDLMRKIDEEIVGAVRELRD